MPLLHGELSAKVIQAFYEVHSELGSGFPESVYAAAMEIALGDLGLKIEREVPIVVHFRRRVVGLFRADSVVESKIILEYKSGLRAAEAAEAQLLTYLRSTTFELGLVLNFAVRPSFKRCIMSNDRKGERVAPFPPRDSALI